MTKAVAKALIFHIENFLARNAQLAPQVDEVLGVSLNLPARFTQLKQTLQQEESEKAAAMDV